MARMTSDSKMYTFRVISTDLGYMKEPKVFKEDREVTDQFGRTWVVTFETKSQAPTGLPQAAFRQVLGIPFKYMGYHPKRPYSVFIKFDQWVADLKAAKVDWERTLQEISVTLYGEKATAAEPTDRALALVGPPPEPWELIALYQAGDKYLTGQQEEPTKAVRKAAPAWLRWMEAQAKALLIREQAETGQKGRERPLSEAVSDHNLPDDLRALMEEDQKVADEFFPEDNDSGLMDTPKPGVAKRVRAQRKEE